MNTAEHNQMSEYLRSRAWFRDRGWPITRIELLDHVRSNALDPRLDPRSLLAVTEVSYPVGSPELYVLPLAFSEGGEIRSALEDAGFAQSLVRLVREDGTLQTANGKLRGERVPGAEKWLDAVPPDARLTRLSDRGAGTSVVLNERVVLKLLRRAEPGEDPELETHLHLARTGSSVVPDLLGLLRLEGPVHSTVALLRAFVPARWDGWDRAIVGFQAPGDDAAFLGDAWEQGRKLGHLHRALGTAEPGSTFSPEPVRREDLERWSASLIGRLGVVLASAASAAPELARVQETLVERATHLARLAPVGWKIRVHGNPHLRRLLQGDAGWQIVDVAGELDRTAEQRREKQVPMRDLAALLRSYDDAAVESGIEDPERRRRLARVRRAVLEGYRSALAGSALLPESGDVFTGMLEAMELEGAARQLGRALERHPDRVSIAARALCELAM